MANTPLPVAFEFITSEGWPIPFVEGEDPAGTGFWVGTPPYLAIAGDGSYAEDFELGTVAPGDPNDTTAGVCIDTPWDPPGGTVDLRVDWRVYCDAPRTQVLVFVVKTTSPTVDGYAAIDFVGPGWHSGTTLLSEAVELTFVSDAIGYFLSADPGHSAVMVRAIPQDESGVGTPGYTYITDQVNAYAVTPGGTPLRLMQRGDGLGMGSGHILGTGTRQSSTRLFGSL